MATNKPHGWRVSASLVVLTLALASCALSVPVRPARLDAVGAGAPADLRLSRAVEVRLSTGYTRTLPAGSRWRAAGRLPEGVVWRPVDSVFAIEGRNVHEAYLVVHEGRLTGFYLPGEAMFSPLDPPLPLPQGELP